MENDKNQVVFNIYGGSIQILPTATQAVQYFYGDQFARLVLTEKEGAEAPLTAEERRLLVFMESVEAMRNYVALLDACEDAAAVGRVVAIMCENEPHLDSERIVKKEFIETLLPFIPKVLKGRGIDNLRVQNHLQDYDPPRVLGIDACLLRFLRVGNDVLYLFLGQLNLHRSLVLNHSYVS